MLRSRPVLECVSLGAVIGCIAELLGWSPVGRVVLLVSVEGPGSAALSGHAFKISEVRAGNLIVVRCADEMHQEASSTCYMLRPRHSGWTAGSLMASSIAVTVHEAGSQETGPAVAIAVARVARVP